MVLGWGRWVIRTAVAVWGGRVARGGHDLPGRQKEMTIPELVGRGEEQRVLRAWRDDPASHVMVSAAPGLGRSALLEWLVANARAQGANAFVIAGADPAREPGYGSWVRLAIAATRAGVDVPPMLLVPRGLDDGVLADTERYIASLDLLERLGVQGGVVAFDDVHRIDVASLELLAQLATGPQPLPALVVLSACRMSAHPDARGRAALRVLAATRRHLYLDVLSRAAIAEMALTTMQTSGSGSAGAGVQGAVQSADRAAAQQWAQRWAPTLRALTGGVPGVLAAVLDDLRVASGERPSLDVGLPGAMPRAGSGPGVGHGGGTGTGVGAGTVRTAALPASVGTASFGRSGVAAAEPPQPAWVARVTRTLQRRLDELAQDLDEDLVGLLAVVALADGELDESRLALVVDRDVDVPVRLARELGLLRSDTDRLQVAHPFVAMLLRHRVGPDAPAHHARIGQVLLDLPRYPRDGVLALTHLLRAGDRADARQVEALGEALLWTAPGWDSAAVEVAALEPLWLRSATGGDRLRWRRLGLRLGEALRRVGQRERAWAVAGEVLEACPDDAQEDLVAAVGLLVRGQDRAPSAGATVRRLLAVANRLGEGHAQTPRLLAAAGEVALPLPSVGADLATLLAGQDGGQRSATPGGRNRRGGTAAGVDPPAGGSAATSVLGWTLRSAEARELVERADRLVQRADRLVQRADGLIERADGRVDGADRPAALDEPPAADPEVRAVVDLAWTRVHRAPEQRGERLARADRAARATSDPAVHAGAMSRLVVNHLLGGARHEADRALEELRAIARDTGDLEHLARERTLSAMLMLASGDPRGAMEVTAEAAAAGQRAGVASSLSDRVAQESSAAIELGRALPEFGVALVELAELHPLRLAGWCWVGSVVPEATGGSDPDPAVLLALVEGGLVDDGHLVLLLSMLADVVWLRRRRDLAPALIEQLVPWRDLVAVDMGGVYCHGSVARPLAGLYWLAGDLDGCIEAEAQAADVEVAAGLHRWRLTGELDRLRRAGEDGRVARDEVRSQLAALSGEAGGRGLARLVGEARALLAPPGGVVLTDRQRAVLRGLATGATYAQIAEELRFSHSTVRKDAIAAYRALAVDGRDDAVALASLLGLLDAEG